MNSEQNGKLQKEALKHAAEALQAMRDALLTCSDMLREHQFETDMLSRQAAADRTDALLDKLRAEPSTKRPE